MKNFNRTNFEYYTFGLSTNIIEKIEEYLLSNYSKEEFKKACIVFGGKRPGIVLKKSLSEKIKSCFIPPTIFSVEEFVCYIVSKKEQLNFVSDLELVYLLYETLVKTNTSDFKFSSFIEFVPWGYEILGFLEEMMLEEIEPNQLIVLPNGEDLFDTKIPPAIKSVVKNISEIYTKFYSYITEQKIFTRGLGYKLAAEYSGELKFEEFDKIIFVTPFYLHKTELKIISNLTKNNKIVVFFQGDQKEWRQIENLANYFNISIHSQEDKICNNIQFYSVFDNVSEANCVYDILKNLDVKELDKTVVVLPLDETATVLINSLPDNVKEYNLVCGYPLRRNVVVSLLKNIFDAQIAKKDNKYYTNHYIEIIKNPLVRNIKFSVFLETSDFSQITTIIFNCIEEVLLGKIEDNKISKSAFINLRDILQNKVLMKHIQERLILNQQKVTVKDVVNIISAVHNIFFLQWEGVKTIKKFCFSLKKTLNLLLTSECEKNMLNLYSINRLFDISEELENSSFSEKEFVKEEIFKLFFTLVDRAKLSFFGSPVRGLQILGFYETRNLNFDRVIICDVNEGILPHLERRSVLIPYTFLIQFGVNRLEIEEEIQRYHFKRLLSQAKEVYLIYIETDEKEKSRFVEQMIWDIQKSEKTLSLKNVYTCYYPVFFQTKKREIKKTDEVVKFLKNFCYSPTAIDTYLVCPLKFHHTYVLRLQEQEEIEEPEGKDIGEFIHNLLAVSFQEFIGKKPVIDEEFKKNFLKLFEKEFDIKLAKRYKSESFLVKKIMKLYLEQFLNFEQERLEKEQVEEVLVLEQMFEEKLLLNDKQVYFKYRIDRVDKLQDGSLLVIDYKTGYVPQMNKNLEIEQLNYRNIKKQIKSFQLPLYVDVVQKKLKYDDVDAMFYNIKEPERPRKLFKDSNLPKEEVNKIIFSALNYIINEILDPQIPFYEDTEEPENCLQCAFKYLCR
jgi:ATP-dependent helicase/nuclease subunit B